VTSLTNISLDRISFADLAHRWLTRERGAARLEQGLKFDIEALQVSYAATEDTGEFAIARH
jgi:hypothetical protein